MNESARKQIINARNRELSRFKAEGSLYTPFHFEKQENPPDFLTDLSNSIQKAFGENRKDEIFQHFNNEQYWLDTYESQIYEELSDLAGKETLRKYAVAVMPSMKSFSFLNRYEDGTCGIEIYHGIFVAAGFLARAVVYESMLPDSKGTAIYNWLKDNFLEITENSYSYQSRNFDTDTDTSMRIGALTDILIRFFALHELGHGVLSHYAIDKNEEYDADIYAMDRLLSVSGDKDKMWQTYAFISLFFSLADEALGSVSNIRHPNGKERSARLYTFLKEKLGEPDNQILTWFSVILDKWRGNMIRNINFSVYTTDAESILKDFQGEDTLVSCDGISLSIASKKVQQGNILDMTTITFFMDMCQSVSQDILVAFIYEKFLSNGKNTVAIEGEFAKNVEDLTLLVKQLHEKIDRQTNKSEEDDGTPY